MKYTVYVRYPHERDGFVDPPLVDWDPEKEQSLWRALREEEHFDWQALSSKFHVSERFLLQQAAWLYEHHLRQVKMEIRRLPSPKSPADSDEANRRYLEKYTTTAASHAKNTGKGSQEPDREDAVPAFLPLHASAGSSFSELSDASNLSALEEAFASNMRTGMASRISNIFADRRRP